MADITRERTVYVVWNRAQWPIDVYEKEVHAITSFKRMRQEGHTPHITRCRLVPQEELRLVRVEEHLTPVNEPEPADG